MTAPTDQLIDMTKRSQDAYATIARTWADSMRSIAGAVLPPDVPVPSVQPYVDGFFDLAEKMLSEQRDLAHHWINATLRATEVVTEQAAHATKTVSQELANETEAVIDDSAEATRATGEQAARTTEQAARTTESVSSDLSNGTQAAAEKAASATAASSERAASSARAARTTPKI